MSLFLRKLSSVFSIVLIGLSSFKVRFFCFFSGGVTLGRGCRFGSGVTLRALDGGRITLMDGVFVSSNALIEAKSGNVVVGEGAFIGVGTVVSAKEGIEIGSSCLLAEYVTIRDQNHSTSSIPYRFAGFEVAPISIGNNVWVGAKATILKGVSIGDDSVVAANSVVLSDIPSSVLAAGAPAIVKKEL